MNRVYSLSNIEFFTLLTTIQKKEFWSFCGNNASFGQKEYNEGIFLLYRREILGRVDDFFSFTPEFQRIVDVLSKSEYLIDVDFNNKNINYGIYFATINDNYVISTPEYNNSIALRVMNQEEFDIFLSEAEIIPDFAINDTVSLTLISNTTGVAIANVVLKNNILNDSIEFTHLDLTKEIPYSREIALSMMKALLKGGQYDFS